MEAFTGTRPVAAAQAFDTGALEDWLRRNLPGFAGPLSVAQFKGGQSNPTYRLDTPGARYVLRSKPGPAAKLLPSAHAIEREFRVLRALAATDVPVARVFACCEDESVLGRAFYVMDFVEGRVLWDPALPGMSPAQRGAIHDEANRVIAALHRVDPIALGLADYGRPGNYFMRQIDRWSRQYRASAAGTIPAMDQLADWLPQRLPAAARDDARCAIVHGDLRLDNLIFHAEEPRVLAVLDWELSTLGHPLADFSYHCLPWHLPPALMRGIGGLDLEGLGIPGVPAYRRRYAERTGQDPEVFAQDWNFYLAYNLFRLAAIAQGIAGRVRDGVAASAQARETAALAGPLAERGWGFAQETRAP